MLLRSLKLVHFQGVPDLQARDLRDGAVGVPLPSGVPARIVADALRFAFLGRLPAERGVISEGQGYTWVEAGFRTPEGATASIFRGMDRRGAPHVSLREDGSMRITSEPRDVGARLEDLLGAPADAVDAATFLSVSADPAVTWPASSEPPEDPTLYCIEAATVPLGAPSPDVAAVEAARRAATEAAEALRRALRARSLRDAAAQDLDELLSIGSRLRRDRTDVAVGVDKVVADRERIRLRLRRVNEYRDLAAAARTVHAPAAAAAPARAPRPQPARIVEWGLGLCAIGLLALLVVPATAGYVRNDSFGSAAAGLGLIVASGSYLYVASRRHHSGRFITTVDADVAVAAPRAHAPVVADDRAARESLRARFADLGDPDAPGLVDDLRSRLSALDDEAAPLQRRLERLDDALSLLDVEAGRAARALHRPMPPKDEAPEGFGAAADMDAVETRIANLGDSIHQASVERDALVAQGAPAPVEAARAAEDAFARLATACGVAPGDAADPAAALTRARLTSAEIDMLPLRTDADAAVAAPLAAIDAAADGAVARAVAPAAPPAPEQPTAALASAPSAAPSADGLLGPLVASLTGGVFTSAAVVGGALELSGPAGAVRWADLEPAVRSRVALAAGLRAGERALGADSGGAPRVVVLDAWPEGFASEEQLVAFAAEHAPRVTQVVWGRPGAADAAPTAPGRASQTRSGDSARRGDRRRT